MAQASESRQMPIFDPAAFERSRKLILAELRIAPRLRNGADVGQLRDPMRLKRFEELVDRLRRMADGENRQGFTTVRKYERIADNSASL